MLKTSRLSNNASVNRLVKLWAKRYVADLSYLSSVSERFTISDLVNASSEEGRIKTVGKMKYLIQTSCNRAGLKTSDLFCYIPNVVLLNDVRRLANFAGTVYSKALEVFLQQAPSATALAALPMAAASSPSTQTFDLSNNIFTQWAQKAIELPAIQELATVLEPYILQLQEQHLISKDPRTIGFISTQFHFTSEFALKHLTIPEQVLIRPYFKFIEEQTCIPWQRVCSAAAKHPLSSPSLAVVEQMLPISEEIARTVYDRSIKLYSTHRSRRGGLTDPGVKASTIRDMSMLQSYLWLCVLEESMEALKQELIPLCVMVFPTIDVKWELIAQWTKLLMDELRVRIDPKYKSLVLPYTEKMQEMFSNLEREASEIEKGMRSFVAKEKEKTL